MVHCRNRRSAQMLAIRRGRLALVGLTRITVVNAREGVSGLDDGGRSGVRPGRAKVVPVPGRYQKRTPA